MYFIFEDDNDELILWIGWPTKALKPDYQLGSLVGFLTTTHFRHATSRVWTCEKSKSQLCRMKWRSSEFLHHDAPEGGNSPNATLPLKKSGISRAARIFFFNVSKSSAESLTPPGFKSEASPYV